MNAIVDPKVTVMMEECKRLARAFAGAFHNNTGHEPSESLEYRCWKEFSSALVCLASMASTPASEPAAVYRIALENIAAKAPSFEPRVSKFDRSPARYRCFHCGHAWQPDDKPHHDPDCAYIGAKNALATTPSPTASADWRTAFEALAAQWDGCQWEDVADVGASMREDFAMHLRAASASVRGLATEADSEPDMHALCQAWSRRENEYVDEYELDSGEGAPHSPSEFERLLIADAIAGLLSDDEFTEAYHAWDVARRAAGYKPWSAEAPAATEAMGEGATGEEMIEWGNPIRVADIAIVPQRLDGRHTEYARTIAAALSRPAAPAEPVAPPEPLLGWKLEAAQQAQDSDGDPVGGVWELGHLDGDGNFYAVATVDTGNYDQPEAAEPLARAILARLAAPVSADAQKPCDHDWVLPRGASQHVCTKCFAAADSSDDAQKAVAREPLTEEQQAVLSFLYGTGNLRGCGFGTRPERTRGPYWWRQELREAFPGIRLSGSTEGEK